MYLNENFPSFKRWPKRLAMTNMVNGQPTPLAAGSQRIGQGASGYGEDGGCRHTLGHYAGGRRLPCLHHVSCRPTQWHAMVLPPPAKSRGPPLLLGWTMAPPMSSSPEQPRTFRWYSPSSCIRVQRYCALGSYTERYFHEADVLK